MNKNQSFYFVVMKNSNYELTVINRRKLKRQKLKFSS